VRGYASPVEEIKGVSISWADGWHDGWTSGIASWDGSTYWFDATFDPEREEYLEPRRLLLYRLTDEEAQRETEIHNRFERLVGNTLHCLHLPPEQRHGPTESRELQASFYEWLKATPSRDYTSRVAIGWTRAPG
jgi:hypothetical protein